jgi:predicted nucleic acid-binding protein
VAGKFSGREEVSAICIIDTSVFLNILNVPGKNDRHKEMMAAFKDYISCGASFILPMATIIETGNHIAQNGDGELRRETAKRFCDLVKDSMENTAPFRVSAFPTPHEVLEWLDTFPDHAGRNKKLGEGTSLGDLSIIEEFNKCRRVSSMSEIFIWSLDADLEAYHFKPAIPGRH